MKTSESIYKLIVENSLTAILLTRPDGTILEVNKAACDLFQYTQDELKQKVKKEIIDYSESIALEKLKERKKQGKTTGELTGIKKNGEHFPIEFSSVIFYDDNGDEVNCTTINDISQIKKAEREITLLINNTKESYILLDKKLNIVSFNRQFQELYKKHFKLDIIKGKCIIDYGQPERKEIATGIYKRVLEGNNEEYELIIPVPDGPEKIYILRYHPARNERNIIIGVFVTATDITEEKNLKRKEDALLKQSEQYNRFIENILQHLPIGITVNNIRDGKPAIANKNFSDIYGWDNNDLSDVNTFFEKVYPDKIYRNEIRQQMKADIESGDPERMTWKDIMITTKAGKTRIVNAKNIPLPEQGLMISTVVDVTNEFRHNDEINRTKIKQESLINGTADLIWSVDANFCIITANNAYLEMIKMATNRLIVEGDTVLVPEFGEALNKKWESYYRRTLKGERFSVKEEVYNPLKQQMEYGRISFNPMRNKSGEIFGIACFSKNVTEETINLLALEKAKAELDKIMDSSMDMICAVDADGHFIKVSAACTDILGYKPEEMIGKHINDFIIAEDHERTNDAVEKIMSGNSTRYFENRYLHKNGQTVPLFWSARWDEKEKIRYGVARDATEKIKDEEELKKSKQEYKSLFENNPDGVFSLDLEGNFISANEMTSQIGDTTMETLMQQHFVMYLPPDEIERVVGIFEEVKKGISKFYETKIITEKGNIKYISVTNIPIILENKVTGMYGIIKDITNDVKTREYIKFQADLLDSVEQAVIASDIEGNIFYWNGYAEKLYGWKKEEAIGKNTKNLLTDDPHYNDLANTLMQQFKEGKSWSGEFMLQNKKGKAFPVFTINSPVYDTKKQLSGIITVSYDITVRKSAEQQAEFERLDKEALINNTTDFIWSVSKDFRLIAGNKAFLKFLKDYTGKDLHPGDELLIQEIFPADLLNRWKHVYTRALSGDSFSAEFYTPAINGFPENWSEISFNPILKNDKIIGAACYGRDTTEKRNHKRELLVANTRLETAQQLARLGYWQLNLENNSLYWSKELYEIWGISREILPTMDMFLSIIHNDDREKFIEEKNAALNGKRELNAEYRIVLQGDTIKWMQAKGKLIKDIRGKIILFEGTVQDITERKLTEQAVAASQERFRVMFTKAPLGIALIDSLNGRIYDANETFAAITGRSANEIKQTDWMSITHPDDVQENLDNMKLLNEKKIPGFNMQKRYIKPDGSVVWIQMSIAPIDSDKTFRPRHLCMIENITERRQSEEKIRISNQRYEYVTRATFDAVWDWDVINDTIYWGEGFQTMFGYSLESLKPDVSSWTEHIHPDDIETVLNSIYAVIESNGSNWTAEYRYIKSDGNYAYVSDRGIVIRNKNDKAIRMVGAMQDITDTKEAELMLKELNDQLEKRAIELEVSNTELERFAYVASHDLQEPLRMVSSFLQLLERKYKEQLDETAEQYIHFAIDGAKRMKTLINDLLEYSRLGTNKDIAGKTDMNEVMEEVLITFSEQIKELDATIRTGNLPVLNNVREVQMVQLLQNLIGNALKYHSDKKPAINISAVEDEHKWTFSVKDNGIGFDKKFAQKVFVIFQRLHHSNEYAGTGIGLSICKKIMDIHGGRIWVETAEGEGSIFYFSIPKK